MAGGVLFEVFKDPSANAVTAGVVSDKHPLDLCGVLVEEAHPSATDGLVADAGDEEQAARWLEARRRGGVRVVSEAIQAELFRAQGLGQAASVRMTVGDDGQGRR